MTTFAGLELFAIEPCMKSSCKMVPPHRSAPRANRLIYLAGTPSPAPIPPSACIPVPAQWSDLIVARVYACVVRQGGGMDGQETETQ